MKDSLKMYWGLLALGVLLFAVGGFLLKGVNENNISSVCIGVGAGLFGMSVGKIISLKVEAKYPDTQRQLKIEINDERNTTIRDKAGASTCRIMNYTLSTLTLIFVLLKASMFIVLLMVAAIILQAGLFIYFSNRYSKEI